MKIIQLISKLLPDYDFISDLYLVVKDAQCKMTSDDMIRVTLQGKIADEIIDDILSLNHIILFRDETLYLIVESEYIVYRPSYKNATITEIVGVFKAMKLEGITTSETSVNVIHSDISMQYIGGELFLYDKFNKLYGNAIAVKESVEFLLYILSDIKRLYQLEYLIKKSAEFMVKYPADGGMKIMFEQSI